jgi:hypothetical protein
MSGIYSEPILRTILKGGIALPFPISVIAKHNAPEGHNRDVTFELKFLVAPSQTPKCEVNPSFNPAMFQAIEGFVEALFANTPPWLDLTLLI